MSREGKAAGAASVKGATKVIYSNVVLRALAAGVVATVLASGAGQKTLQVNVRDGEGAFNDIRRGQSRMPVVEVRDDDGHLLQGDGVVGRAEIRQSNTLAGGDHNAQSGGHGRLKILIVVAGAAGGVAIAAGRAGGGKSSSTTPSVPPTTLTVGAVTIGGLR